MAQHKVTRLRIAELGLDFAHRSEQVIPGQLLLAQMGGLGAEVAPEHGEGLAHDREHHIQRLPVQAGGVDGRVQRVFAPAAAVQGDDGALDTVHGGGQRVAHLLPGLHLGLVGPAAHIRVGMRTVVDQRGGRNLLLLAVFGEGHVQLGYHCALQLGPEVAAAQVQLGRQGLFGFAHQVAALLGRFAQVELVLAQHRVLRDGLVQTIGAAADPGLQPGELLLQLHVQLLELGELAQGQRVVGIGGDKGVEVGPQGAPGEQRRVGGLHRTAQMGGEILVTSVQMGLQAGGFLAEAIEILLVRRRLQIRVDIGKVPAGQGGWHGL